MSKRRLLLADDSITIQKVVNLTFADEGIEVIAVGDGDAAMERFVQATPDLVMVDVNMPGFDGYKICEIIKQDEETKHIPVILLVGSFEPFDEDEARRVGADDYLTKPFQSIRQLVGKVTALLGSPENTFSGEEAATDESEETSLSGNAHQIWSQTDSATEDETLPVDETDENTIEINQIRSLPADESQKFSSRLPVELSGKTDSISAEQSTNENASEPVTDETFQSENTTDVSENSASSFFETSTDFKQNSIDASENVSGEKDKKDASANGDISLLELDDINLLDLSPVTGDGVLDFQDETIDIIKPFEQDAREDFAPPVREFQPEASPETLIQSSDSQENVEQKTDMTATQSFDTANLSPEIIDAIATRVVEKLSDKVIREIAWEVVPQLADLIIQKMAQDKLNK
ncbi:MAG: response regulator [Acidobacteriota bacterium]|nr:response regulator [Acidobacteriota bacterium]